MTMHAYADRLKVTFLETADLFKSWQSESSDEGIPQSSFGACQDVLDIHDNLPVKYREQLEGAVTYSQAGLALYNQIKREVGEPASEGWAKQRIHR